MAGIVGADEPAGRPLVQAAVELQGTRPVTLRHHAAGRDNDGDGMRKTILAMTMAMVVMPLQAQVPPPPAGAPSVQQATVAAAGIRPGSTVIVDGTQPGPGLWLVRKGAHDLWILGTLSPLPAKFQWQTRQIDEVIANAQEVMYAPSLSVGSDIGKFRAMLLLPSLIGVKNNPDGKRLSDVLSPETYVRWSAFRDRFLDRMDIEQERP